MGFGGISIWQLLIVLAIVILLFGTKRLKGFGSDLGNAVKGFRKAMDDKDEDNASKNNPQIQNKDADFIDGDAERSKEHSHKKQDN